MNLPHLRILKAVYYFLHADTNRRPTAVPESLIKLILEDVDPAHTQAACHELSQLGLLLNSRSCQHALGQWPCPNGAELTLTFENQNLIAARNGKTISTIPAPYHALPDNWWNLTPKGYRMHSKLTEVERSQRAAHHAPALPHTPPLTLEQRELGLDTHTAAPYMSNPPKHNLPPTSPFNY